MSRYASKTEVPVSASKMEIERLVERYGAGQFMSGWASDHALVAFTMSNRQIRFILPMPSRDERIFTHSSRGMRSANVALSHWQQACRQRWRALALVIKAKLEAIESGISTFDSEFMANIVLPNGRTVGEDVRPRIAHAYETREMPALLPDYSGGDE